MNSVRLKKGNYSYLAIKASSINCRNELNTL